MFKTIAKEKARKMFKENKVSDVFEIKVNNFNTKVYKLKINIHGAKKHKTFSYNIEGVNNTYKEKCILMCF